MKRSTTFQPNSDDVLSVVLECPVGRLTCERFPLGKVAVSQKPDGSVLLDADVAVCDARLETRAAHVGAQVNGMSVRVVPDGTNRWAIRGK